MDFKKRRAVLLIRHERGDVMKGKKKLVSEIRDLAEEIQQLAREIDDLEEEGDDDCWWDYPEYEPDESGWYLVKVKGCSDPYSVQFYDASLHEVEGCEIEGERCPGGWQGDLPWEYITAFKWAGFGD